MRMVCPHCGHEFEDEPVEGSAQCPKCEEFFNIEQDPMQNKAIIERILKAIAQDDMLIEQFAVAVGMPEDEFSEWIDTVKVPDPMPDKVFVTCKQTEDRELNPVPVFYAVHTAQDMAQRQVDRLTQDFIRTQPEDSETPADKFIIIDAPLNP